MKPLQVSGRQTFGKCASDNIRWSPPISLPAIHPSPNCSGKPANAQFNTKSVYSLWHLTLVQWICVQAGPRQILKRDSLLYFCLWAIVWVYWSPVTGHCNTFWDPRTKTSSLCGFYSWLVITLGTPRASVDFYFIFGTFWSFGQFITHEKSWNHGFADHRV